MTTGGIETRNEGSDATRLVRDDYSLVAEVGLSGPGFDLVARLCARARAATKVPASRLKEGMVLAENACSAAGLLLLPAGTRLSATASERLRELLGARTVLVCASGL